MLEFNNKSVLITGGAGFVGSNLVKMLLKTNVKKIIVIDNFLSSEKFNLPDDTRIELFEGSTADSIILNKLNDEFEYVFHLATFHGNINSIFDPIADHDNNTITTLKLFDHLKKFKNIKKVVYSSAGCSVAKKTYDTAEATTEDDPIEIKQDSPYSISKIIGEFYALYYFTQHKLPVVRARFQNVYGPGEVLGAGQWRGTYATIWRNVTPTFIYKALKGMPLPLENNGIATRDFIFVEDICRGLIQCALRGTEGGVYNLATGKEISIFELADTINKLTGNAVGFEMLPKRTWDNSGKRFGSTVKSKNELGFETCIELKEGLEKTIEWTKENLALIEENINKHKNYLT